MKVPFLKLIVRKIRKSIAIVEEGDTVTHSGGLAIGKYVIWKGTQYKVTTAMSYGETISGSKLSAVSDGIANELNSKFNTGINRSYGSQINIIGYDSSSNAYTAPRDGYIMVQIWNNDSTLALWMSPSLISVELNTNFRQFAVFASMGSKWHITGSGSNRSAYFVPLIP